jgi:hypothetical protein
VRTGFDFIKENSFYKYMKISNVFLYSALGLAAASLGLMIYGNNIKNRKSCVICGRNPPCLANSNECKPNGIEGKLLSLTN